AASSEAASGSPSTPVTSRQSNWNVTSGRAPASGVAWRTRRAGTSADVERRRAVDADALRLQVRLEPLHPELASDAALLDAAEGALGQSDVVGVDPDVADAQPARDADRTVEVARPHRAAEPELVVVGQPQRLGLGVEGDHRQDRPEDLLARDRHRRG